MDRMTSAAEVPSQRDTCLQLRNFFLRIVLKIWLTFRYILDYVIDLVFGYFYDETKRQHIPPVRDPLLMESAISLAEKIRNREVSAVVVVQAFVDRIKEVNTVLNAVVDNRFVLAIQEAKEVDKLLESGSLSVEQIKQKKPFLGVPFTTKDSTACKGLRHTLGLVSRRQVLADEDADVVILMKEAGAILIAVTNIPEVNMWIEVRNNVYGQTLNPYNTTRTVGGSSGGEAAIIAAVGSPLGVGTDIGGSIRLPAFCCGIFGHKPTSGLTPLKGLTRRTGKEEHTMVSAGPMCKYAQDLAPFLQVLVGSNISKLQLFAEVNLAKVQFMYMEQLKDPRASSVYEDLLLPLRQAVTHFQCLSEKPVVKISLPGMRYSFRLWRYWMSKEPFYFPKELANREGEVSLWVELLKKLVGCSEFTLAAIMLLAAQKFPKEKPEWAEEATERLRAELLEKLGEDGVLLFPSSSMPAHYHYASLLRPYNFSYFCIFNALHLPVTQVPMGLNKDGLPVGIQVVAAPYKDHLCFAVAKELQKAFGGWVPPFKV
ncbi:fatty-acid amide hydrolase 2 isoform X2 [Anabrus simplex]